MCSWRTPAHVNTDGSFTCACPTGYTGDVCLDDVNECLNTPCQNGGTCANTDGSFNCMCSSGAGDIFIDINECAIHVRMEAPAPTLMEHACVQLASQGTFD